jgi:hypothetical protein
MEFSQEYQAALRVASIFIEFLLLILGLYIIFFKSYASEKGKNAATKEDVAEITQRVEVIKSTFIAETEKLKGELLVQSQMKIVFHNDKRKAILNLYESFHMWYNQISDAFNNYTSFNSLVTGYFDEFKIPRFSGYNDFLIASAKFQFYNDNEDINKSILELRTETLQYSNTVSKFFTIYQNSLLNTKKLKDELEFIKKDPLTSLTQKQELGDSILKETVWLMNTHENIQKSLNSRLERINYLEKLVRTKCMQLIIQIE